LLRRLYCSTRSQKSAMKFRFMIAVTLSMLASGKWSTLNGFGGLGGLDGLDRLD
jgi:hypothetical protein